MRTLLLFLQINYLKSFFYLLALLLLCTVPKLKAQVSNSNVKPDVLSEIGIDQKLNEQIPLDLVFRDEAGQQVKLQKFFGEKPVILALVYYDCPMLCTMILNGLLEGIHPLKFDAGREFNIVTVSFDPREKPELAASKKHLYLNKYARSGAENGWHFLTGEESAIQKLTQAVGFRYKFDPKTKQYIHASAIMVATPQGKLSHYFYGVEYSPRDLRLALLEASDNKIGSPVDQLLLYCYHYDPTTGKYGVVIMNVIRVAGLATVLVLGSFMILMLRRDKHGARNLNGRKNISKKVEG